MNMLNRKSHFLKSIILFITVMLVAIPDGFGKGHGKNPGKFLKEIKKVMKCIPKITKGLTHLASNPKDKQALNSLQKCMSSVKKMSSTCDQPETMALAAAPDIGGEIAATCATVGKFDIKIQLAEQGVGAAGTLASNPTGAAESMAKNQANNHTNSNSSSNSSKKGKGK